ncbi:MAG: enoyl-CoA hydratase-related protein [Ilumatobacteraceae bacterium]
MAAVLYEVDDLGVALITLNRPDTLNAMNAELMEELHAAVAAAALAHDVRVVVLSGAGRGFCSGGDLGAAASRVAEPELARLDARIARGRRFVDTSRMLHDMGKPTIAMVNGPVAGAGVGLIGACDLRFAGRTAVFLTAFDQRGFAGDYGATYFWTRNIGSARTRELFLLGERLDAEQAFAYGLYTRLFADADLRAETFAVAHRLAANYPSCWRLMKSSLNTAEDAAMEAALDVEVNNMSLSMQMVFEEMKSARRAAASDAASSR